MKKSIDPKDLLSYMDQDTCDGCKKRTNICLDCPRPKQGNNWNGRAGRQFRLSALNRIRRSIEDINSLPYFPINPTN